MNSASVHLGVELGRLRLSNPILVASGTFGYAREMAGLVDLARLGGILPKTITQSPRIGNPPPRTVETTGGMLNSIGLDNDGIEVFIERHLPYLATLGTTIIVSVAGKSYQEFVEMAARLDGLSGVAALELNISCPNVSGGVDFGTDPAMCQQVVAGCRQSLPGTDSCQAHPKCNRHSGDRAGGRGRWRRCDLAHQYLPGHGDPLAQAASDSRKCFGRAERSGDQTRSRCVPCIR